MKQREFEIRDGELCNCSACQTSCEINTNSMCMCDNCIGDKSASYKEAEAGNELYRLFRLQGAPWIYDKLGQMQVADDIKKFNKTMSEFDAIFKEFRSK